jgi:1,4-alpha-glucan branching enzyme
MQQVPFALKAPEATAVLLVGDFTSWEQSPVTMRKVKGGRWKTTVSLNEGRYEYRFLVDGQWQDDPDCLERAPNAFGSEKCVRVVA